MTVASPFVNVVELADLDGQTGYAVREKALNQVKDL